MNSRISFCKNKKYIDYFQKKRKKSARTQRKKKKRVRGHKKREGFCMLCLQYIKNSANLTAHAGYNITNKIT